MALIRYTAFIQEMVELHAGLNPALWDGESLDPVVGEKLLGIAKAWAEFANIPWENVKDVFMVGSSAGYNWTKQSDVDVHLFLDRKALGFGPLVDDYLQDKKTLWALKHDIKVKGFPVELYAQDVSEEIPLYQGKYSLLNKKWLTKPEHAGEIDDATVDKKVEDFKHRIDHMIENGSSLEKFHELKDRISAMRKEGIKAGGEYGVMNLVFKALRNAGYLDKMTNYVKDTFDKEYSV